MHYTVYIMYYIYILTQRHTHQQGQVKLVEAQRNADHQPPLPGFDHLQWSITHQTHQTSGEVKPISKKWDWLLGRPLFGMYFV